VFVVDSSVWIEHFADRPGREVEFLRKAIEEATEVFLCGPILQEVLQGIRKEPDFQKEWRNLVSFPSLESTRWTFLGAATLYRFLRRKGITVNSFDTTIAATCLEHDLPLLTCNHRDFEPISRHAGLKLA
jgi:hypothetical protein